jgi:hypothetical protein
MKDKKEMTAQIAERLLYEGSEHAMCTNPLDDYFAMAGVRPLFASPSTALWRGYVGRWEIVNDRLYLVGLQGTLEDGSDVTLASIFPDFPERAFAHWYTGTVRVPQGRQLEYVHMGYGSTYERDLLLKIDRGVVVATEIRTNGEADDSQGQEGYGIGAMLIYPTKRRSTHRAQKDTDKGLA